MIDFFALLQQPRQPWLDPDALKEEFYRLTRITHPDVGRKEKSAKFEDVNEAYRVLSEPKLRIQHLLALEGIEPAAKQEVPADLQDFFLRIGTLSQKIQSSLAQIGTSRGALTLSLRKSELLSLRSQTTESLRLLSNTYGRCLMELQNLNKAWKENRAQTVVRLQQLHDRIAYLSRWLAQLKEMELQLILRD